MKRKNIIANILSIGLVLNSFNLNSFASTLSEDGRYETFKENSICINDVYEASNERIKLEGRSLVNISNIRTASFDSQKHIKIPTKVPIVVGKEYTIMFKSSAEDPNLYLHECQYSTIWNRNIKVGFNKGLNIINFTIEYDSTEHIRFSSNQNTAFPIELTDIMLFEGKVDSIEDNYAYFSDIESGFENSLITQDMVDSGQEDRKNLVKYKVEVKSKGKNLVDTSKIELGAMSPLATKVNQSIILNGTTTEEFTSTLTQSLDLKVGKTYSVSMSKGFYNVHAVVRYTQDGKLNYITATSERPNIIIPEDSWSDIIFYYQINGSGLSFSNQVLYAQIEEGSIATEYSPYTETTSTVYLNSPLLEGDTLEYINGQLYHVHRYSKEVFDGSEDEEWRFIGLTDSNFDSYSTVRAVSKFIENTINSYNNKGSVLINYPINFSTTSQIDFENSQISSGIVYIRINKNRLNAVTIEAFNDWLFNNNLHVVYKLADPIYEKVNGELSSDLFEGTTYLSSNSNIPVNMEITVDRTANRAREAIDRAISNPTLDNIAIARMWVNLIEDSLAKDNLHNEINNIAKVEDLKIDKKKVSANLDLYVKSENALSMSLDTNSVTFENYNNTEDIEKLGAVNITVSSSLPYDLNAYMPNGISNMDGTKTMDSNLLNIREDSTNIYKPFTGIDTKVSLKEDCSAGNNNLHTIDFKLNGSQSYDVDVYRTVIKFEAQQK